jgi:hypothetical protein
MSKRKAKHYRCKVGVSILFTREERSHRFGRGAVVDEALYSELVERKCVEPEWFEEVTGDEPDELGARASAVTEET